MTVEMFHVVSDCFATLARIAHLSFPFVCCVFYTEEFEIVWNFDDGFHNKWVVVSFCLVDNRPDVSCFEGQNVAWREYPMAPM